MSEISEEHINNPLWYISAMLLASAILYPLCLKFRDSYVKIFSWLIGIAIFGLLINHFGGLDHVYNELFLFRKGFYRVLAGMSIGIALHPVVEYLNKKKMSDNQIILKNICMCMLWFMALYLIYNTRDKLIMPFVILLIWLACALTLSNYKKNILFDNGFIGFLGKMSMPIYLVNFPCARLVHRYVRDREIYQEFLIYILVTFVVAIIVFLLGKLFRTLINKTKESREETL